MSRRGRSSNDREVQRREEFIDPFSHMKQMMKGFGGFEDDPFFNRSLMNRDFGMIGEDLFKFSDCKILL